MTNAQRRLHLAGFMHASHVVHSHALWRHPRTESGGFLTPEYYQRIAQTLERGKFDLVFFADTLALPDAYGGGFETAVEYGSQGATKLDSLLVATAIAVATRRIGIGVTRSTTYFSPYDLARGFATLDHLSRGRAAWNIVTSNSDSEALNFGFEQHLEHDDRYDRADEFVEVAAKLWDSWGEGALALDKESGRFADPSKVKYVDHQGKWFRAKGPLTVPRSPQGRPVFLQAGSSDRGKEFAAKHAEAIFTSPLNPSLMTRFYADVKGRLAKYGREPEDLKILSAVVPFIGRTDEEARERQAEHHALVHPLVGLASLSRSLNYDLAEFPVDAPLDGIAHQRGSKSMLDQVVKLSREKGLTLGEIGQGYGQSRLVHQIVGSPTGIADQLQEIFEEGGADGFVISPAYLPGAFEDFVDLVVPEFQRRGLFRTEYQGATLRDHLGLKPLTEGETRHADAPRAEEFALAA